MAAINGDTQAPVEYRGFAAFKDPKIYGVIAAVAFVANIILGAVAPAYPIALLATICAVSGSAAITAIVQHIIQGGEEDGDERVG